MGFGVRPCLNCLPLRRASSPQIAPRWIPEGRLHTLRIRAMGLARPETHNCALPRQTRCCSLAALLGACSNTPVATPAVGPVAAAPAPAPAPSAAPLLAAAAKPAPTSTEFALATGVGEVVAARFIDRVGKGIHEAPRDALLSDITPPNIRGDAFGLCQSLDTMGAFAGPLLVTGLKLAWPNDFRAVFWVAAIPGVLTVLLLQVDIREPEYDWPRSAVNPIRREALAWLDRRDWRVAGVFALARFSRAFLKLRA